MFASPAFAQAAGAAPAAGPPVFFQFVPFIFLGLIFYFLLIRPQQKQQKQHRAKLDAVAKGDEVVTGGGLIGKAVKVSDTEVEVELAPNVRVRALKAMLSDVTPRGTKPAND